MGILHGNIGEADIIKANLIDFFLDETHYDLIVNEPPFLRGNRWADLIAICGDLTIGVEIKSKCDNIQNVIEQITDYCKVFNEVYLILDEKFIENPKINDVPKNVGIIVVKNVPHECDKFSWISNISNKIFSIKRKAKVKKLLNKQFMLSLLWRRDLEMLAPEKKNADMDVLRDFVIKKCPINAIQKQIIISLKFRYADSYKNFLIDRDDYTTVEDLRIITRIKKNPVF
jgi:hypothetical protein